MSFISQNFSKSIHTKKVLKMSLNSKIIENKTSITFMDKIFFFQFPSLRTFDSKIIKFLHFFIKYLKIRYFFRPKLKPKKYFISSFVFQFLDMIRETHYFWVYFSTHSSKQLLFNGNFRWIPVIFGRRLGTAFDIFSIFVLFFNWTNRSQNYFLDWLSVEIKIRISHRSPKY